MQALTKYLTKELALQGTRQLAVNDDVKWAVLKLFEDNRDGDIWFESQSKSGGFPEPRDWPAGRCIQPVGSMHREASQPPRLGAPSGEVRLARQLNWRLGKTPERTGAGAGARLKMLGVSE